MKLSRLFLLLASLALLAGCGNSADDPIAETPIAPIARVATYLLDADRGGSVGVYRVDPTNGALAQVPGSPFPADNQLNTLGIHPNGRLVYGGTDAAPFLEGFSMDPTTGALTALPGFPIASLGSSHPFLSADGQYLYNVGDASVDGFRVNQETGALTRLIGFPFAVPGMVDATSQQVSSDSRFLYLPDRDTDQVFVLALNAQTGAVSVIDQEPTTASGPTGSGLTPDGRYLYLAHDNGTVTSYQVNASGRLTALPGAPVAFAGDPALSYGMAFVGDIMFVPDARSATLNAFRISNSGALSQVAGYPRSGGGASAYTYPYPIADIIYMSDAPGNVINAFLVNDNESLTSSPGSPFTGTGSPRELEAAVVAY